VVVVVVCNVCILALCIHIIGILYVWGICVGSFVYYVLLLSHVPTFMCTGDMLVTFGSFVFFI